MRESRPNDNFDGVCKFVDTKQIHFPSEASLDRNSLQRQDPISWEYARYLRGRYVEEPIRDKKWVVNVEIIAQKEQQRGGYERYQKIRCKTELGHNWGQGMVPAVEVDRPQNSLDRRCHHGLRDHRCTRIQIQATIQSISKPDAS